MVNIDHGIIDNQIYLFNELDNIEEKLIDHNNIIYYNNFNIVFIMDNNEEYCFIKAYYAGVYNLFNINLKDDIKIIK